MTFMLHQMKLSAEPFGKIARGEKVIESRLYDDKRWKLSIGDEIEFSENEHPENKVLARVVGLLRYKSFRDLFAENEPALFGGDSREFLLRQIRQFYSEEDEKKYGVLGLRIAVIH